MRTTKEVKCHVNYVVSCNIPKAATKDQVQKSTYQDPTLWELKGFIQNGWMDGWTRKVSPYRHTNNNYYLPKLTIGMSGDDGRIIIIVVPSRLRTRMLEIAHQGHQRQVRTKQLLRAHVWFPGVDDRCEK